MNFTKIRTFNSLFQRLTTFALSLSFAAVLFLSFGSAAYAASDARNVHAARDQGSNVIEDSKERIKDAVDTVKSKLDAPQDRNDQTLRPVQDRADERVDKARGVFEEATDKVFREPFDETVGN